MYPLSPRHTRTHLRLCTQACITAHRAAHSRLWLSQLKPCSRISYPLPAPGPVPTCGWRQSRQGHPHSQLTPWSHGLVHKGVLPCPALRFPNDQRKVSSLQHAKLSLQQSRRLGRHGMDQAVGPSAAVIARRARTCCCGAACDSICCFKRSAALLGSSTGAAAVLLRCCKARACRVRGEWAAAVVPCTTKATAALRVSEGAAVVTRALAETLPVVLAVCDAPPTPSLAVPRARRQRRRTAGLLT